MTPYEEAKTQRQGTTTRLFTGNDWRTPLEILELVFEVLGDVFMDPCANEDPEYQFAETNLTKKGTDVTWSGPAFWNNPYSETAKWVEHAHEQWRHLGVESIGLIPPSIDTSYWHEHIFGHEHVLCPATRVCFYAGRIDFLAPENMRPTRHRGIWEYEADAEWIPYKINRYASTFVLFGEEYEDSFCRVFERVGRVVCA